MSPAFTLVLRIIEFIVVFGAMIFVHELGHFLACRLQHIEVEEFGFGFPPQIAKLFKLWGTQFSLNAIPFGGFVRPKGEGDPTIEGGLAAAKPWTRFAVALSGPMMNLITGIVIFSIVFMRVGAPDSTRVEILAVNDGAPAQQAGLLPGDLILSVNGEPIDSMETLSGIIKLNLDRVVTIVYQRDTQTFETTLTPRAAPPEGQGPMGITMGNPYIPISWFKAMPYAIEMTYFQARELLLLPGRLIMGQIAPEQARVVGPVGIFSFYSDARDMDEEIESGSTPQQVPAVNTLFLIGTISIAIGLTNLLPIPALDGGRILFLVPELVFRRRIPAKYENLIQVIGFVALLALLFVVTGQDIFSLIKK